MSVSEFKSAHPELVEGGVSFRVTVEYFALFRSLAKKSEEQLEFPAEAGVPTIPALYDALRDRYRFPLERHSVHVAVNDAYASWDHVLQPGDRVVFIPPVSGG